MDDHLKFLKTHSFGIPVRVQLLGSQTYNLSFNAMKRNYCLMVFHENVSRKSFFVFWILSYLGQTVSCHTLKKFKLDDRRCKNKMIFLWKVNFLLQYLICDCENCLWSFYFPFIDNRVRTGVLLFSACTCSFAYDLY